MQSIHVFSKVFQIAVRGGGGGVISSKSGGAGESEILLEGEFFYQVREPEE